MIRIVLSEETVRNGERVKGSVTWQADGSKTPRSIEVVCRWRTEGKGTKRQEIVDTVARENPPSEAVIPFDVAIPLYGPLSYDGKLLRVIWEIAVNADLPMARDQHEVKAFSVVPRRWDPKDWEDKLDEDEDET